MPTASAFDLEVGSSIWPKALQIHAQTTPDPRGAKKQLLHLKEVMVMHGADPKHASNPMQYINEAIETLEIR